MSKEHKDLEVVWSNKVRAAAAANPELAAWLLEFVAYASFPDAMEAISGTRPRLVDLDELDLGE